MRNSVTSLALLMFIGLGFGCRTFEQESPSGELMPGVIFGALCEAFLDEAEFDTSTSVVVLGKTRPIYETFALRTLHEVGAMTPAEGERDEARDEALLALFRESDVEIPANGGRCRWRTANQPFSYYVGRRILVLEMSNVVEDPFARGTESRFGVFVRRSLGGASGASWYWVSLERAGGSWRTTRVDALEISDG